MLGFGKPYRRRIYCTCVRLYILILKKDSKIRMQSLFQWGRARLQRRQTKRGGGKRMESGAFFL